MKNIRLGLATLLTVALATMASAQDILDPAFRVIKVNGECQVSVPGQDGFQPAEESKAYPYGSTIHTGARSSLVAVLSEGNVVRVLANANLVMDEDSSDAKIKNVRLTDGEVEVELNDAFHQGGNKLNVETATAICGAVGTHFRVASRLEQDLRIVIIRVIKGIVNAYGDNFEALTLDANDWFSVLSPGDRSFLRLQNMKGEFIIRIKDQDMNDKDITTKEGHVLKIWQRLIPETNERVLTFHLTAPDGSIIEEVIVTIGGEQMRKGPWDDLPFPSGKDKDHPLPPEDFLNDLIDRILSEENVEFVPQPRPPSPPSPTPVGRR